MCLWDGSSSRASGVKDALLGNERAPWARDLLFDRERICVQSLPVCLSFKAREIRQTGFFLTGEASFARLCAFVPACYGARGLLTGAPLCRGAHHGVHIGSDHATLARRSAYFR